MDHIIPAPFIRHPYIHVRDEKAAGTHGGTFTLGAWRTRDINVEATDTHNLCAIATNQITLEKGTYECQISCPANGVAHNIARLYNITDTALILAGTNTYQTGNDNTTRAWIFGQFVLAVQKVLEIQHQSTGTKANDGFGLSSGIAANVYTVAEFWRVEI